VGFAGPVGLKVDRIYADSELCGEVDYVTGANAADKHLLHVDLNRDVKLTAYEDLRSIEESDLCPRCGGGIEMARGIEVGHVFKLGLKYSQSMNATFLDENGKEQFLVMGSYGIGVSRIVAACIEQNHDENGIVFPPPIAPYEAVVLCLDPRQDDVAGKAEEIYGHLGGLGIDVMLDDRDERPGVKFKDSDLVGYPMQIVVGGKGLKKGVVEAKDRRSGEKTELPAEDFAGAFAGWREEVMRGWNLKVDG
jgi:prolyl-tRNA synthetase